ncbi:MAG: hypothetical protein LC104_06705 [Bacteroidales bacterium]|nr:hypothetical protein [Bacteroidales bacterium]
MDWDKFLTPIIVGLLSGAFGSLVAPLVNWNIDKRRQKNTLRQAFLRDCYACVELNNSRTDFRNDPLYARLRPYLRQEVITVIESEVVFIQTGGRGDGVNNFKPLVLDDLAKLESEWDLI